MSRGKSRPVKQRNGTIIGAMGAGYGGTDWRCRTRRENAECFAPYSLSANSIAGRWALLRSLVSLLRTIALLRAVTLLGRTIIATRRAVIALRRSIAGRRAVVAGRRPISSAWGTVIAGRRTAIGRRRRIESARRDCKGEGRDSRRANEQASDQSGTAASAMVPTMTAPARRRRRQRRNDECGHNKAATQCSNRTHERTSWIDERPPRRR